MPQTFIPLAYINHWNKLKEQIQEKREESQAKIITIESELVKAQKPLMKLPPIKFLEWEAGDVSNLNPLLNDELCLDDPVIP